MTSSSTKTNKSESTKSAIDAIDNNASDAFFSQIIERGGVDLNDSDLHRTAVEPADTRFLRALLAAGASCLHGSLLHNAKTEAALKLLLEQNGINVNALNRERETPLHTMCSREQGSFGLTAVPMLIAAGADVSATDKRGQTPLHVALENEFDSNGEIAKALIVAGSDVNAVDDDGESVFRKFLDSDHCLSLSLLRLLVSNGVDVNIDSDGDGFTPRHEICGQEETEFTDEAVCLLLDAGADVFARNRDGKTPLHIALSRRGDTALADGTIMALIDAGSDVNAIDNDGQSVLQLGASNEICLTVLRMLLDAGADVRRDSASMFESAIGSKHIGRFLEMLVRAGADINAVDDNGDTACHFIARDSSNIGDILPTLVHLGAKIDAANKHGETPLAAMLAALHRNASGIIALLDAGASVNATTLEKGESVCHVASKLNDLTLMELLINKYGANINCVARNGETPLMGAVDKGAIAMTLMLLASRATHDAVRVDDEATALHIAVSRSYRKIAEALIDAGANVNARDVVGRTPGHLACASGDEELVVRLIDAGANVSILTTSGDSMLHIAARLPTNGAVIGRLIAAGADLSAINHRGQTVFHVGACNVRTLSALGVGVSSCSAVLEQKDNAGLTPFDIAVIAGNEECLLAMVAAGANVRHVGRDGSTLLHLYLARGGTNRRFIRTLVRLGVDVNALNGKGQSAVGIVADPKQLATLFAIGADCCAHKFTILPWISESTVVPMFFACTDDGSKIQEERFQAALTTEPADTDSSDVKKARVQLATARLQLVRARGAEICIGLQSLRLAALQLCEILFVACAPASTHVPFHELWNIAVKVKHFNTKTKS